MPLRISLFALGLALLGVLLAFEFAEGAYGLRAGLSWSAIWPAVFAGVVTNATAVVASVAAVRARRFEWGWIAAAILAGVGLLCLGHVSLVRAAGLG